MQNGKPDPDGRCPFWHFPHTCHADDDELKVMALSFDRLREGY
jgi:hypothetical protein